MTMADKSLDVGSPRTLADAQMALARIRPGRNAPLAEWLAYCRRSAVLYAEIAEIDRGHHHESLFMAERERECAMKIEAQMSIYGSEASEEHRDG